MNCGYWRNPGIAAFLKKGQLVELSGRIWASAWADGNGQPKANLNFHVDRIKFHGKPVAIGGQMSKNVTGNSEPAEDLPF